MHLSVGLLSCLAALTLAAPQAVDYGPCDYNGNPHCKEIMDNTACFLNPVGADEIFNCISGGRDGVCSPRPPPPPVQVEDDGWFGHANTYLGLRMLRLSRLQARWRCDRGI
jgi:hypothetical protein